MMITQILQKYKLSQSEKIWFYTFMWHKIVEVAQVSILQLHHKGNLYGCKQQFDKQFMNPEAPRQNGSLF